MSMKFLIGEIASQPAVVTLNVGSSASIMVFVLIKVGGTYEKFCYEDSVPGKTFSNILVSSVGDKVRVGTLSTSYRGTQKIEQFYNVTRRLGDDF